MLKLAIRRLARRIKLKDLLIKVGDYYVQSTRNTTDDKVWKEAKELIKKL